MPAVATMEDPNVCPPALKELAFAGLFIYIVHYRLDLRDIPNNFISLFNNQQTPDVSLPDWFDDDSVDQLQRSGYKITYTMR